MDFKNTVDKEMLKLFKGSLKSTLKPLTYTRSTGGKYNPNTEEKEGATVTSETFSVLPRDITKDTGKDDSLYITDVKVTVRVDEFEPIFGAPLTSDEVEYQGVSYRLKKYMGDVTSTFYHLFLRGI